MQIIDDRILLFRTRNPEKYKIIPKSAIVGEPMQGVYELAVKWDLDEVRILRNLGVKNVPAPIQGTYSWPGRYTPFKHQMATSSFLTMNNRAFVLSEPGTGKSASCLWAADYLMKKGLLRRVLIVCPLSIMESAWMKDLMSTIIHRKAAIAYSYTMERRIEIIKGNYEFIITNYDGIFGLAEEIKRDGTFDLIIADEINHIKSVTTRRWKALNAIIKPTTWVWGLTGTPAPQSPLDAFGLAKMVTPANVPKFMTAWRDRTMIKISQFKWIAKGDAPQTVFKALQPAIRYTKEMCLDLPPVLTTARQVELTPQQAKYYKLMKTRAMMEAAGETVTAVNAANLINKLLQISAGAAYTDDRETIEFDCSPRLEALMEVLQETDRKVLIFAAYRHSIDTIAEHLKKNHIVVEKITGDVSVNRRSIIFEDFQTKPNPKVLVIQPQAAQHGVTLTAADTVVFWGPVMSVETYIQCIARADRIGQKGANVTVIHLQSSEIEKKMFKQLEGRIEDHNAITKLYEEEMSNISK